jgi:diacylglycerol kinase (ATP)
LIRAKETRKGFVTNMEIDSTYTTKRRRRVKLVFNPAAGAAKTTQVQLTEVISAMQAWKLMPEVFLLEPGSDLAGMVKDALARGIHLFVACGGDGTISAVAKAIQGQPATLGIIPAGTQNNIARALCIPQGVPAATAILRTGHRIKTDMGKAVCGGVETLFIEICSIGLMSAVFPSIDDIQHGHLEKIGDFLSMLVTSAPSEMKLVLEGGQEIKKTGHAVLVSNMPYIGRHYQVGGTAAFKDGLLDVLLFAELTKMDLIGHAVKGTNLVDLEDDRIQHYHVRSIDITTLPPMPVMADGLTLGEGAVHIEVLRRTLAMITPPAQKVLSTQEIPEV